MEPKRDEKGASAVEYALIVVAVAAIIVAVVVSVGLLAGGMFDTTCTSMTSEMPGDC